jgi:hypothetical protein
VFSLFRTPYQFYSEDIDGGFVFDSIPAGEGNISYFIDYNSDGEYSQGNLIPWQPPEPYYSFTDTIEARARWDIEGVQIDACDICSSDRQNMKDTVATESETE